MKREDGLRFRLEFRDLYTIYARRLDAEYDDLIYRYRLPVAPASISVADLGRKHGSWDPLLRVISIDIGLIRAHPWDVVVEILKHELAHQVAHEAYGSAGMHDSNFVRACDLVGVAPWARRAAGPIPEDINACRSRVLTAEEEKLQKRVEKLLALATSSNEHEALAAMQRVREMYARHNLRDMLEDRRPGMTYAVVTAKKKRTSSVETMIASILVEHYFVRAIHSTAFDAEHLHDYRVIEILGLPQNVAMAEYVYYFLLRELETLWRAHRRTEGCPGSHRRSYMLGVLAGFRGKLRAGQSMQGVAAQAGVSEQQCKALVRRADRELADFVASRYPRLSKRAAGSARLYSSSFSAGQQDGKSITINRAVGEATGSRGRLLGSGDRG